jgi:hypothetical protein
MFWPIRPLLGAFSLIRGTASTSHSDAVVPPMKFNAPADGQIGRNLLCSGSIKTDTSFKILKC